MLMATYKVPQDVEADDKLLGPFTFRQFLYLLIVVALGFVAWGLSQLFIGLIIIPLPAILLFGALALPLRKDQPMEIYMAAMVSYFLKPRLRLWDPEGVETLIEITAPRTVEVVRTKDISESEAAQRLSYLANIVDSGGWAIRGVGAAATASTVLNNDVFLEAQGATDILDNSTSVALGFDQMMQQSTDRLKEEARQHMIQAATASAAAAPEPYVPTVAAPVTPVAPAMAPAEPTNVAYNPYPTFQQAVIQPLNDAGHQAQNNIAQSVSAEPALNSALPADTTSTSDTAVSADIMNLVNNSDFSIETIAHEANRLKERSRHQQDPDEVVISLR